MGMKEGFCISLRKGDRMLSFDVRVGYRHFCLHKDMRNYFIFKYDGRYFRFKALPFGWGRSAYWFFNVLKPFVQYRKEHVGARVLPYIDDFLLLPSVGRVSTEGDSVKASREIRELGLEMHEEKGVWGEGTTLVHHLGVI